MKQIFDWLREQIYEEETPEYDYYDKGLNRGLQIALRKVDEAEAKWEADCCVWEPIITHARRGYKNCQFAEDITDTWKFNFCPYCGKKIKIVEAE